MSEDIELTTEVKQTIINSELASCRNTRYLLTLRHRVQKKIGGTAEMLKPIEDELVRFEALIDALTEELHAVSNGKA